MQGTHLGYTWPLPWEILRFFLSGDRAFIFYYISLRDFNGQAELRITQLSNGFQTLVCTKIMWHLLKTTNSWTFHLRKAQVEIPVSNKHPAFLIHVFNWKQKVEKLYFEIFAEVERKYLKRAIFTLNLHFHEQICVYIPFRKIYHFFQLISSFLIYLVNTKVSPRGQNK